MKNICLIFFVLLSTTLIYAQPIADGILLGRGTGSTPFDTSTEITRQTARHFVAFRWELEGSTDGEFSVGTAAFPQKFTGWTDLTSRAVGADIDGYKVEVHVFAGELPQIGEQLQISIRDSPSGTPITSNLLTVGSTNYASCAGFYDPEPVLGGEYTLPPQPATPTMVYNDVTGKFDFQLDVKYLQWDYTWVVDFVPFENDGTLGTNGLAVTACENHVATEFSGRLFAEYWNAYPTGQDGSGPAIINSNNFLGYQHETASGTNYADWVLSQVSCSTVRYSASIVPSDLNNCQSAASSPAIDVSLDNTNEEIVITGALYATAIRPRDLTDATPADTGADFESVSYQYPFEFRFNYFAEEVTQTTASNTFAFTIDKVELITAGAGAYNMRITITTNTKDVLYYLFGETVVTVPGGVTIGFGTDPANAQYQTWILTTTSSKTAGQGFSGSYELSWTRGLISDNSDQTTEVAEFAITLNVATPQTDTGSLGIVLAHYTSNTFGTPKVGTTYRKTDRVFIRSEVQRDDGTNLVALATSEQNSFNNDIWGVYICYVTGGGAPTDCRTETSVIRPVVTLVSGGVVQTGTLPDQFDANTYQSLTPSMLAGFDFLAQPLADLREGTGGLFYVHVQSKIIDGASLQKRMQETMYVLKNGVNGFTVEAIEDPDPSTAAVLLPTIFSILICVLAAVLV